MHSDLACLKIRYRPQTHHFATARTCTAARTSMPAAAMVCTWVRYAHGWLTPSSDAWSCTRRCNLRKTRAAQGVQCQCMRQRSHGGGDGKHLQFEHSRHCSHLVDQAAAADSPSLLHASSLVNDPDRRRWPDGLPPWRADLPLASVTQLHTHERQGTSLASSRSSPGALGSGIRQALHLAASPAAACPQRQLQRHGRVARCAPHVNQICDRPQA